MGLCGGAYGWWNTAPRPVIGVDAGDGELKRDEDADSEEKSRRAGADCVAGAGDGERFISMSATSRTRASASDSRRRWDGRRGAEALVEEEGVLDRLERRVGGESSMLKLGADDLRGRGVPGVVKTGARGEISWEEAICGTLLRRGGVRTRSVSSSWLLSVDLLVVDGVGMWASRASTVIRNAGVDDNLTSRA